MNRFSEQRNLGVSIPKTDTIRPVSPEPAAVMVERNHNNSGGFLGVSIQESYAGTPVSPVPADGIAVLSERNPHNSGEFLGVSIPDSYAVRHPSSAPAAGTAVIGKRNSSNWGGFLGVSIPESDATYPVSQVPAFETVGLRERDDSVSHSRQQTVMDTSAVQGNVRDDSILARRLLASAEFDDPANLKNCLAYLDSQSSSTGRKQRVHLKDPDMKAKLVKLAHTHFELYCRGKGKFYDVIRCKFWAATQGRYDVNVKGYLDRWEKSRRDQVRIDQMKSGVARTAGEWELAMDRWIAVIDDYEEEKKTVKQEKDTAAVEIKSKIARARSNMMHSLASKRPIDVLSDDEDSKEKPIDRTLPGSSKRAVTEQLKSIMRDGDKHMLSTLKEMDEQRMDRWESIFKGLTQQRLNNPGGRDEVLQQRILAVERQSDETSRKLDGQSEELRKQGDKLDQVLSLLVNKFK